MLCGKIQGLEAEKSMKSEYAIQVMEGRARSVLKSMQQSR